MATMPVFIIGLDDSESGSAEDEATPPAAVV